MWQLDSWQAERSAQSVDRTQMEPVALSDLMGPDDPFPAGGVGRPVTFEGTWLDTSFWVEGRTHEGTEGYWAMTPVSVGGPDDPAILVVRGWSASTDADPDGEPPTGQVELSGWLQPTEGSMAVDEDPTDNVFPEVRVADAVQMVDRDLYTGYVVLDAEQLEAMPKADRSTGLQNFLYAVEWFLFGLFAAYIWWRWVMDLRIAARAVEVAAAEEAAAEEAGGEADGDAPKPDASDESDALLEGVD